ncbi:MAG: hypothetical protein QME74_00925 [Candidatus Edwardsbacteria bacterium]|nr:hypothetical protein [Candidatus Edwardsbacteria bacterium]
MQVLVFGRPACQVCKQAIEKIDYFLDKWKYKEQVPLTYFDMDTVDGLAEGAFHEVSDIPTVVLQYKKQELDRWVKRPPLSKELKPHLDKVFKGEADPDEEE